MKVGIQNRILLPILGTLVVIIFGSAMILSSRIAEELDRNFESQLTTTCSMLHRGVANTAVSYKASVNAMAALNRLRTLTDIFVHGGTEEEKQQALERSQATLESLVDVYKMFPVINITDPTGLVVAGTNKAAINKVNVSKRLYFQRAMKGETNFSVPIMSMDINAAATVVAAPLKSSDGRPGGIIYAILPCSEVVRETVEGIQIGKTGRTCIIDGKGVMVAHPDASEVLTDVKESAWGRRVLGQKSGLIDYEQDGTARMLAFRYEPESEWYAVSFMDQSEIDETVTSMRNIILGLLLGGTILIGIIIYLVIRPIMSALLKGVNFAQAVGSGNLDIRFDLQRNDELGLLFNSLREMVATLKAKISAADAESVKARSEAENARKAMAEAEKAQAEAATKAEAMQTVARKLNEAGNIIASATTQLAAQVEQSDIGAKESATRLTEAATAMNEMNATVHEVARNAAEASSISLETREKAELGAQVVEGAVATIEKVHDMSLQIKEDMNILNSHAQDINRIMAVISDIADQTNLLALNAAIEAARAGEAGRGFAVVADEVRKLAEKTMESTQDVGNAIRAIQNSTDKSMHGVEQAVASIAAATEQARNSGSALVEIVANVQATADQVQAIATASEQQSAASEEINHSISLVNETTSQTAVAMGEAAKAVNELSTQASRLTDLIEELRRA
ncbi:MAG: methyl-accepting chemotaxis protein [Desulfovibrio sp.]|nr:methyl-accepting chemotaxis protein [Desulfovibrio sp.]